VHASERRRVSASDARSGRRSGVSPVGRRLLFATKAQHLLVFAGLSALMQGITDLVRAFEVRRMHKDL